MASINLDLDYFAHPKTDRLVRLLGKGSEVIPVKLWVYCGKFHPETGTLTGISAQEIEAKVAWWGKKGKAVQALLEVGFLEKVQGGFQVHDWLDHSGHIRAYKERAQKAAKARWENASSIKNDASSIEKNASSNACTSSGMNSSLERGVLDGGGKTKKPTFIAPTVEQVREYCSERGNQVDPETFVDFYASKGWKVGKNSMKDWKASVRTWEKNGVVRNGPVQKPGLYDGIAAWVNREKSA